MGCAQDLCRMCMGAVHSNLIYLVCERQGRDAYLGQEENVPRPWVGK